MREEFLGQNRQPLPFDPKNPGSRDVPGGGYLPVGPMSGSMVTQELIEISQPQASQNATIKQEQQDKDNVNVTNIYLSPGMGGEGKNLPA